MSDGSLRALERRWRESGVVEDGARFLLARERAGQLTEAQIYTAAYLGNEVAQAALSTGMYDQTGQMNDHITGICPCGWCRWDEGPERWINGLLYWAQNLPFPGIDGPHADQEMKIRIGRALAASVWEKVYTPENPVGTYAVADIRADRFLAERTEEARAACRELWDDPNWGAPDWVHQILYYVFNPNESGNLRAWFRESSRWLTTPKGCYACGDTVIAPPEHIEAAVSCSECEQDKLVNARLVVETALLPWVLPT